MKDAELGWEWRGQDLHTAAWQVERGSKPTRKMEGLMSFVASAKHRRAWELP